MVPYVIVTLPRSGSNLLVACLLQCPYVNNTWETFGYGRYHSRKIKKWDDLPINGRQTVQQIFRLFPHGATGFKFFYDDINKTNSAWDYLIENKDIRIIYLKRDNYLERVVSLLIAKETAQWCVHKGKKKLMVPPFVGNTKSFDFWFANDDRAHSKMESMFANHNVFKIEYESFISQFQQTMTNLFEFLEVPIVECQMSLEKQGIGPKNQLLNYDDLKAHYSSTPYGKYFIW